MHLVEVLKHRYREARIVSLNPRSWNSCLHYSVCYHLAGVEGFRSRRVFEFNDAAERGVDTLMDEDEILLLDKG